MRGLVGFRAQGMNGWGLKSSSELFGIINTSLPKQFSSWGVNKYILPKKMWCHVFCVGGGAAGNVRGSPASYTGHGGGGGSAGHSKLLLPKDTLLEWQVGRGGTPGYGAGGAGGGSGGSTTFSINGELHGSCAGGEGPSISPAGRRYATGFQINRYGGGSGERGEGGQPLIFSSAVQYGRGAGGFMDIYPGVTGDVCDTNTFGGSGIPPVAGIGAGGGCSTDGAASCYGGNGQVLILMFRA